MAKFLIIAHNCNTGRKITEALDSGADFAEIDVWKAPLRKDLIVKHFGLAGGLGLGKKLEEVLPSHQLIKNRLYFDFKWGGKEGVEQLFNFLKKTGVEKFTLSSTDWQALLYFADKYNITPHFTIANSLSLKRFQKDLLNSNLNRKKGISIRHTLATPERIEQFKNNKFEIVAWTVNSQKRALKLFNLGIDGVISDNWPALLQDLKGLRN